MIFKRKKTDSPLPDKPPLGKPLWVTITAYALGVVLVVMLGVAWYWSRTPDVFWVNEKGSGTSKVVGYSTVDTLIRVADTLLEKPGGYAGSGTRLVMARKVMENQLPKRIPATVEQRTSWL